MEYVIIGLICILFAVAFVWFAWTRKETKPALICLLFAFLFSLTAIVTGTTGAVKGVKRIITESHQVDK